MTNLKSNNRYISGILRMISVFSKIQDFINLKTLDLITPELDVIFPKIIKRYDKLQQVNSWEIASLLEKDYSNCNLENMYLRMVRKDGIRIIVGISPNT